MNTSKTILTLTVLIMSNYYFSQGVGINTDGTDPIDMMHVKTSTASSADGIMIENPNGGNGDTTITLRNNGSVDEWTFGFDDSDNDDFKISKSASLGTTNALTIDGNTRQLLSGTTGTAADPSWSFESDDNTGFYNIATDILAISSNGIERIRVGNSSTIVNDVSNDYDFRVESNGNANMLFVDGGNDVVRIGNSASALTDDGLNIIGPSSGGSMALLNYVWKAHDGNNSGSTIGIGSVEYFTDGLNVVFLGNAGFAPNVSLSYDIGDFAEVMSWDDILGDDFWNVSDSTLKKDIKPIPYGLNEVLNMNPVTYILKQDPFQEQKLGLIAQEILPMISEVVKTYDYKIIDENMENGFEKVELDHMFLNYVSLVPVLIQALKDEDEKVTDLQNRIAVLEKIIEAK